MPKIWDYSTTKVTYNSASTRHVSLDQFLGGAAINDEPIGLGPLPIDSRENLEEKFNSGVNRTDVPRMWGHPSVDRRLANKKFQVANDIKAWRRDGGEPLYRQNSIERSKK